MRPSLRPVKKRLISAIKRSNSIKEVATRLNISERSAYRYIKSYGIDIRNYGFPPQHPHTPDTPELRNKIAITYLQEHAIIKVHRKLHVGRQRLSRILKQTGFAIFDSNVAKLIQRHFNGEHSLPYSKKLSAIITGELLGDGNLSCPANSKANQWSMPLKNYIDAIETPKRLAKELGSNTLSTTEAIQKYNFTAKKLVNAQIAHFRLHKSPLEEPWIRYVAKQFENDSYSVNFVPTNRSIHMTTQGTVQLYNQYRLWYPSSKKQVPKNLNLTPEIVLHWYVGDGSLGKNQALLHTQCFKKSGNEYLVDLLMNDTGIMAKIGSFIDPRTKKPCYQVHINRKKEKKRLFAYFENAPSYPLDLAKRLLPWKFDQYLRKKDLYDQKRKFVDNRYLETFLDLLEEAGVDISSRNQQLHYLFPWKFSNSKK